MQVVPSWGIFFLTIKYIIDSLHFHFHQCLSNSCSIRLSEITSISENISKDKSFQPQSEDSRTSSCLEPRLLLLKCKCLIQRCDLMYRYLQLPKDDFIFLSSINNNLGSIIAKILFGVASCLTLTLIEWRCNYLGCYTAKKLWQR